MQGRHPFGGIQVALGIVFGAAAAAAVVFLVLGVGRYSTTGDGSASWLAAGFAVASMGAVSVLNLATVNYTMPVGWIVALVGAPAVAVALFWLTGRRVGWKRPAIFMLVGILIASMVLFVVLAFTDLMGFSIQPLFRARAQQIATAQGFTALLPPEGDMDTTSGRARGSSWPGTGRFGEDRAVDVLQAVQTRGAQGRGRTR